ncbi:unnamed protein product [Callosobruchus maculatus]|uniref:Uncharacterized protein n=1 Tax=Callosobruchus maculatus TaxID=64391 RepID=A0A653D2R8_CALMS|nr:unnamed protein product [Callosobruchus maculatus]
MTSQSKETEVECIKKGNNQLASILSSIPTENQSSRLLEQFNLLIEYLPCFNISVIDEELLKITLPQMKSNLEKIYDDNILLSDTADDDFVLNMIRENLKVSYGFMTTLKLILEFLMTQNELSLIKICSIPVHTAQMLLATFDHCKKSTELYKQTYNMELLELFRISQETHAVFLNLMEACSIICDLLDNNKELDILREVLDLLCEISLALSDLNLKSMSSNWKGYMAIVLKFAAVLKEAICLDTPVKSLKYQIVQNLASLDVSEPMDEKLASKTLTITGFLIKVALKLLDLFWNGIEKSCNEVLQFCLTILSYPPELFQTIGYSDDCVNLIKTNVVTIEQLSQKMYSELESSSILNTCIQCCDEAPFGVVLFLNNYLGYILENPDETVMKNTRLDEVIKLIFHCFGLCTYELYFTPVKESIYDKLIVNISGCVLTITNLYMETEEILLRNVLHENIFCALLAVDVWDLVLLNTNPQFQLETITKLIKVHGQLDFGINTYRPEASHFKFLLRRLFRNMSNPMKLLLTQTNTLQENTDLGKVIGLRSFPEQQSHFVAELCSETIKKIQIMDCDQFGLGDLICVGENLEILSTVNLSSLPVEEMRSLVSTTGILWT